MRRRRSGRPSYMLLWRRGLDPDVVSRITGQGGGEGTYLQSISHGDVSSAEVDEQSRHEEWVDFAVVFLQYRSG